MPGGSRSKELRRRRWAVADRRGAIRDAFISRGSSGYKPDGMDMWVARGTGKGMECLWRCLGSQKYEVRWWWLAEAEVGKERRNEERGAGWVCGKAWANVGTRQERA